MLGSKIIVVFFFATIFNSCADKELRPAEYVQWVKDYSNGIHKKREINKIVFDVQYQPYDFIILNEKGREKGIDSSYTRRLGELKQMQYFTLKLSIAGSQEDFLKYGIQSEKEYYDRLYYYSFHFQEEIFLEEGGKRLPCKLFHFERSYDLSNNRTFVLAFERTDKNEDKTLVIDSEMLGLGSIKINFEKKDLNSIPQLKI